ncbi:MAG: hypothetical protein J5802_08975 [Butyrivibrio sp.]|nr:hypothetical protein [Butyrivibrio sp.]
MKEKSEFLKELKAHKYKLSKHQYLTIKGQALKGNVNDARKGMVRILGRRGRR